MGFRKKDEYDKVRRVMFPEKVTAGADGDVAGILDGVAVNTATDGRERDGPESIFYCQCQGIPVTGRKIRRLAAGSTAPNGTDRVDNIIGRKPVAARQTCLSRLATTECTALGEETWARGPMYCPVDASPPEQCLVRGINDSIDLQPGNVGLDDLEAILIVGVEFIERWHRLSFQ